MRRIFPSTTSIFVSLSVTLAVLLLLAALRWFGLPAGELADWLVAVGGFWWLLGVLTIPWNLHFAARAAAAELAASSGRQIRVDAADRSYVAGTVRWTLVAAVLLHLATAAGFAGLALAGWSGVGWWASAAALALTAARPLAALYEHVALRLSAIDRRARFPRDDVRTLEGRLDDACGEIARLRRTCDASERGSWAHRVDEGLAELRERSEQLGRAHSDDREANAEAHRALARQTENAARQLGEDSQFLGSVRDIIRFIKEA